jgi:hypothetical protein
VLQRYCRMYRCRGGRVLLVGMKRFETLSIACSVLFAWAVLMLMLSGVVHDLMSTPDALYLSS